jgi:hypothetical protein
MTGHVRPESSVTISGIRTSQALGRNDVVGAETLAFEAIPFDPDSYLPYQTLGEVFARRHESAAAISAYSRAIEKLTGAKGHYRLMKLDESMRRTELQLLREKIARLKSQG